MCLKIHQKLADKLKETPFRGGLKVRCKASGPPGPGFRAPVLIGAPCPWFRMCVRADYSLGEPRCVGLVQRRGHAPARTHTHGVIATLNIRTPRDPAKHLVRESCELKDDAPERDVRRAPTWALIIITPAISEGPLENSAPATRPQICLWGRRCRHPVGCVRC